MRTKHKLALAAAALVLAGLSLGFVQIIQEIRGPYGHTITDGPGGFTITGTTTMAYTALDSVSTKRVIVNPTTGDSVILGGTADAPTLTMSVNGTRGTIAFEPAQYQWNFGGYHIRTPYVELTSGGQSIVFHASAPVFLYGGASYGYFLGAGYPDSTKGVIIDSLSATIRPIAPGKRPTTARLGQIIVIDGTGDVDSLLIYLGGTWELLK